MPAAQVPSSSRHYDVTDRPAVDVRHTDGDWYPGRLHAWTRTPSGWRAVVSYTTGPGLQHYLDVPAAEVRPAVDRSRVARPEPVGDQAPKA